MAKPPLQCKHCPTKTHSTEDVARHIGWRIWRGTTIGGKDAEDVVCPVCAGNAEPPEKEAPGWRVRCNTCDWEREDEYDEGPLTPKEAKYMARDHECEPQVEIAPPTGDTWYADWQVKDDGSLHEPVKAA